MPKHTASEQKKRSQEDITRAIVQSRGVPPDSPQGRSAMRSGNLPSIARKKKRSALKDVADKFRRFLPSDVLKKAAGN